MIFAELRASAWKYGAIGLAVLVVAAVLAAAYFRSDSAISRLRAEAATGRAEALEGQLAVLSEVLAEEREKAAQIDRIAAQYEQDKDDAQVAADRLAADLRAGNVRLRDEWAGCATDLVSGSAATARLADENTQLREKGARDLAAIGDDADATVRGLQAVIRADRQ